MNLFCRSAAAALLFAIAGLPAYAQTNPMTPDIPAKFNPPETGYDYVKRVVMVPMRDGMKLYTVIVIPKGATQRQFSLHALLTTPRPEQNGTTLRTCWIRCRRATMCS